MLLVAIDLVSACGCITWNCIAMSRVALNVLQLHLLALQLRNDCRCLATQSLRNCNCSRSIGSALGMVVGLVGWCGFGAKSKLVALCSKVKAGSDRAATKPCPVPFGALFAPVSSGIALHLVRFALATPVAWLQLPCYSHLASVPTWHDQTDRVCSYPWLQLLA